MEHVSNVALYHVHTYRRLHEYVSLAKCHREFCNLKKVSVIWDGKNRTKTNIIIALRIFPKSVTT